MPRFRVKLDFQILLCGDYQANQAKPRFSEKAHEKRFKRIALDTKSVGRKLQINAEQ